MPRLAILNADEINAFEKPPKFTVAQREKYFHLSDKLSALKNKVTSNTSKLAIVIQWGYFRATGRFFLVSDFHVADVKYVAELLAMNLHQIDLKNYHENRKTARDHQKMILDYMGFKLFDQEAKQWGLNQMENLIEKQMQPREIIYYIASQFHQRQIEIPSYYYFTENITSLYNAHEKKLLAIVKAHITEEQQSVLDKLIDIKVTPPLISEWKYINQKFQAKAIQIEIERFINIKSCFYMLLPLLENLNFSASGSEYYATWVHKAKISQLRQMPDNKKLYLYLSAFVQHQFYLRQESLIDILIKSVQAVKNQAKKKRLVNEQKERNNRNTMIKQLMDEQERLEVLVANIAAVIRDKALTYKIKVENVDELLRAYKALLDNLQQQKTQNIRKKLTQLLNDDEYYQELKSLSLSLQRRVANIVKVVDFDEVTSNPSFIAAIQYFKNMDGHLDASSPMQFLEKKHQAMCLDEQKHFNISLYKILLFIYMVDALKSGKLNIKYSYRYRAIQDYLISQERWEQEKDQLLALAGLSHFANVETVLAELKKQVEDQYDLTNQGISSGKNQLVTFNHKGKLQVDTPKVDKQKSQAISELLNETGIVPIIQLLHDVNDVSDFTDCFRHYSVKSQKLKPDAKTLIAGIMAIGHNIGIHKISQISKGINSNTLAHTVNWFFTLKNIQSANDKIIAMIKKLALSKVFKHDADLTHTASDGQKYQVLIDSLLANYSFKYFGKDQGISAYTFIDDSDALFYGTVLSSSEREAAYVIDGLLHNNVVKSDIHSTDMHGFTESIFAATHFIGTSFAPRFKRIDHQTLYGFSAKQTYVKKGYKVIPSRAINQTLIQKHWEDILRFMVTIKLKETTASQLFKRLSSYAKDHPLYKAIKEFGRIIKTKFILSYVHELPLRQHIEKLLSRIELSNKFSKAIFFDKNQEFDVPTSEEQTIVVACKSLIQNAIVLWNYLYLSQRLIAAKNPQEQKAILQIIKNGSVMTWQHVNMRGEYDFTRRAANDSPFDMAKILALKVS